MNKYNDVEIGLLLEGVKKRYGYDFTNYSGDSLRRRITRIMEKSNITHFTELLDKVFHDEEFFDNFLKQISITVTELFRDPLFYLSFRKNVIPLLKTFPFIKIWHAGCATGEEVYSMAILLHEEGFLERSRIYATDFNKHSLEIAGKGVYPLNKILSFEQNYIKAGGKSALADYYSAKYDLAKFKDYLRENITFSYHNLVTDYVFGEMNVVCCRNVLIYFDRELQKRVFSLFRESLRHGGILCLGTSETVEFSDAAPSFKTIDKMQRIFKKHEIS